MKVKLYFTVFLFFGIFIGCSPEEAIQTPKLIPYLFYEEFLGNTVDGNDIAIADWTNYAQFGTVKWKQGIYSGKKYAEFTSYQSGESTNIAWLISPPINMDLFAHKKLAFDIAQAYVSSPANTVQLLISTDYDGTDVLAATWIQKNFTLPPMNTATNFDFFSSGIIDLSSYSGNIYIAFRAIGSGMDTASDGTFEIDNIRIFNQE